MEESTSAGPPRRWGRWWLIATVWWTIEGLTDATGYVRMAQAATEHFNQAVANYNHAIAQFPAVLLAWLFSFKRARTL